MKSRCEINRKLGLATTARSALVYDVLGAFLLARRLNEFRSDQLLPAAGAGLRFTLDKKNHINYRIDWAIGRAGHALSIGIGEAF